MLSEIFLPDVHLTWKNDNYVPLLYALLPAKDEKCYRIMWDLILSLCNQKQFPLTPLSIHLDFEQVMHNVLMSVFPACKYIAVVFILHRAGRGKFKQLG